MNLFHSYENESDAELQQHEPDVELVKAGTALAHAICQQVDNEVMLRHSKVLADQLADYVENELADEHISTSMTIMLDASVKSICAIYWSALQDHCGDDIEVMHYRLNEFAVALQVMNAMCSQVVLKHAGDTSEQRMAVDAVEQLVAGALRGDSDD